MKSSCLAENGRVAVWLLLAGMLVGGSAAVAADETASTSTPRVVTRPTPARVVNVRFSRGIGEIVSMVQAKVAPEVILAYINRSTIDYNPTAAEIILLRRLDVSSDIVMALLRHGAELRMQSRGNFVTGYAPPGRQPLPPAFPGYNGAYTGDNFGYAPPPMVRPVAVPFVPLGPVSSFNNSFPTFVNGTPVYSGYYASGLAY